MKPILSLSLKSLRNRRGTAVLSVFAIAVSVALLLGVEKIRTDARTSFANTISGTDLIVGARSGAIQLLLYSVFRIGNATNNISIASYREIAAHPQVAWTIPLSLGDSHRGYRVLGTNRDYFVHYRFGRKQQLTFAAGRPFEDVFDTVLGADVAKALGYRLGDPIVVSHGLGEAGISRHKDKPFRVAGILAKTGTPVDRTVHVSLEGIEAMHVDWRFGAPIPGTRISPDKVREMNLRPKAVTSFLVGLKSRMAVFSLQRKINEFRTEPLLAILPGVTLQELWDLMRTAETALAVISAFVVVTGLLGMLTMLLAGLNERRREMAILRSVGARPAHIFGLFVAEAAFLTVCGVLFGLTLFYALLYTGRPLVDAQFGLFLSIGLPTQRDLAILALILAAGFFSGIIPAYQAYRRSLADGMMVRV
jgi:putative ABC transport system permease protein